MNSDAEKQRLDERETRNLVSGYCHRNQKLLESFNSSIPDAIIEIIVRFYRISAIINLALGQCGNQMLMEYLKSLAAEYAIDTKTGKSLNNKSLCGGTYLRYDSSTKTSCARSLCVDLDPGIKDILKSCEAYPLLDLNNFCMGNSGANNDSEEEHYTERPERRNRRRSRRRRRRFHDQSPVWGRGFYTDGPELRDECVNILRKEIESHDEPQAIQFMHSLGRATGSGMGTLMMLKAKEIFPDLPIISFSVMPSAKVSDVVVEPYNAVLSIMQLQEHCDGVFVIDNEALYRLATNQFANPEPTLGNLNFIANQMVNDVTSLFRYDDSIGFNVSSFLNEMTITPNLKYFTFSRAPFYDETGALLKGESNDNDLSVLTKGLLDVKRSYTDITYQGASLSTLIAYRGLDSVDHGKVVKTVQDEVIFSDKDVMTTSIRCNGAYGIDCGFMVSNNTSIKSVFNRVLQRFSQLLRRKALVHWYTAQGMDEMGMQQAFDYGVRDLNESYEEVEKAAGK